MQAKPVREGIVAADRDQHVDPERLDHAERVGREVERPFAVDPVGEVGRHVFRLHAARVRARRMQERAPGAVDRTDDVRVERQEPVGPRGGVVGIVLEQRRPAAPQADHLVSLVDDPVDDRLDAGVEPRHVAATRQDPDPHSASSSLRAAASMDCSTPILIQASPARAAFGRKGRSYTAAHEIRRRRRPRGGAARRRLEPVSVRAVTTSTACAGRWTAPSRTAPRFPSTPARQVRASTASSARRGARTSSSRRARTARSRFPSFSLWA